MGRLKMKTGPEINLVVCLNKESLGTVNACSSSDNKYFNSMSLDTGNSLAKDVIGFMFLLPDK